MGGLCHVSLFRKVLVLPFRGPFASCDSNLYPNLPPILKFSSMNEIPSEIGFKVCDVYRSLHTPEPRDPKKKSQKRLLGLPPRSVKRVLKKPPNTDFDTFLTLFRRHFLGREAREDLFETFLGFRPNFRGCGDSCIWQFPSQFKALFWGGVHFMFQASLIQGQRRAPKSQRTARTAPKNFLNNSRALPNKTRALRQIAPESSPESSAKSLSQKFFGVPLLSLN